MRGACEFNYCNCTKFWSDSSNKTKCINCGHGHVWHKNTSKLSIQPPSPPPASAPKLSPANRIDMSCLVCNENRRNILVLPCKHFILCNICYDSLQKKECIMCRQEITSCIKDIYI